MKRLFTWLCILSFTALAFAQKPQGNTTGPKKGALVIVGGGKIPAAISDKFIELAGGREAHFVYIPTATEDEALNRAEGQSPSQSDVGKGLFGLKNVTILHTRDRNLANTKAFAAPLRKAAGVWFGGGRQWRLVDSYAGTETLKEIWNVLKRGGVIGGSSAGASIQASYMVRGAREGNTVMMAKGYETGFGFMQNIAIDQHINTRKRESDLKEVITAHPELLGVGLYESTAMVVHGNQFDIIGEGQVAITDGKDYDGKSYYLLAPGERFDLKKRQKIRP
ncbi:MAG: cyanophycinase [Acidobacteria bacterium]|nr:cyanophycinase [Acidobacteriota bacterium]